MFSNLKAKPINYNCQNYISEDYLCKFLVSSSYAHESFITGKEVINDMASLEECLGEALLKTTIFARQNATGRSRNDHFLPKVFRAEVEISNDPAACYSGNQRGSGSKTVQSAGDKMRTESPYETVVNRRQLGFRSAIGTSDRMRGGSTRSVQSGWGIVNVATVATAPLSTRLRQLLFVRCRPELSLTPPAKTRLNGHPSTKCLPQLASRYTRASHAVFSTHHNSIVQRWSATSAHSAHTVIKSIFPRSQSEFAIPKRSAVQFARNSLHIQQLIAQVKFQNTTQLILN